MSVSANDNAAVLTVRELAMRWRCHRQSVIDKIHRGELYAFKVGKRTLRIAISEVLRFELGRATG